MPIGCRRGRVRGDARVSESAGGYVNVETRSGGTEDAARLAEE